MAAVQHHFVAGVRADTDVQYPVATAKGIRYQNLHVQQSAVDSACGLCASLVAIMALRGVPRAQVEKLTTVTRGPLRALWELARENYFDGTVEADLIKYVSAFPSLRGEALRSTSARRIGKACAAAIAAGHVPIVGFATRGWSHFAVVIGVEVVEDEPAPRALLILDPSGQPPWACFYNARLELRKASAAGRFRKPYSHPYRFTDGEVHGAWLEGLVVVQMAQPP